jgi:hypothetical protein
MIDVAGKIVEAETAVEVLDRNERGGSENAQRPISP